MHISTGKGFNPPNRGRPVRRVANRKLQLGAHFMKRSLAIWTPQCFLKWFLRASRTILCQRRLRISPHKCGERSWFGGMVKKTTDTQNEMVVMLKLSQVVEQIAICGHLDP